MKKIHILTINDRKEVFEITKNFWESHGWEVIPEYNDNTKPAIGRNRILKKFYESDDDWIAMADDDVILTDEEFFINNGTVKATVDEIEYPKLNLNTFLSDNENIFNSPNLPTTFSAIRLVNMTGRFELTRLAKDYSLNKDLYDNNWVFERQSKIAGVIFHQNTKKKFNKEFFFDENLEAAEDWEWCFRQIDEGFSIGQLVNILYREVSKRSVLFQSDTLKKQQEIRKIAADISKKTISEKYQGITIMKNGGIGVSKWMKTRYQPQIGWTGERTPRLILEGGKNEV